MYTFFFFPSKGQGGYWLFTPIEECSSDLPALWAPWVILGGGGWRRVEPGPGPRSAWRGPCRPWFSPSHESLPRAGPRAGCCVRVEEGAAGAGPHL